MVEHHSPGRRSPTTRWVCSPTAGSPTPRSRPTRWARCGSGPTDYAPGDTDLAWARITWWRGLLASAMDGVDSTPARVVVSAPGGNPSAALLTGWLGARLGIPVEWEEVGAPGIQAVTVQMSGGDELGLSRHDDRTARLTRPGHPDRLLQLTERDLGELLAEELRRLDADEPYSEALSHWSGIDGLDDRLAEADPHLARPRGAPARRGGWLMGAPPEVLIHRDEPLLAVRSPPGSSPGSLTRKPPKGPPRWC